MKLKSISNMLKVILLMSVLLSVHMGYGQHRNRLSLVIENAKLNQVFTPVQLFTVTAYDGAEKFVKNSTAISLNDAKLMQLMQQKNNAITLSIPTSAGKVYELELIKADITPAGFKVATNTTANYNYEGGLHYRGIIKGDNNSIASVSLFNDEVVVMFNNAEGNFVLGKIRDHSGKYLLYNDKDVLNAPAIDCNTDYNLPFSPYDPLTINKDGSNSTSAVNCKVIHCYYQADFAMYQTFSSSVTNTANYVTSCFNQKATLYANEGIPIVISEIFVWTSTDPEAPFTTTSTVNAQFITNTGSTFNGDFAQFLTTRNLGGGIAQGFTGFCNKAQAHSTCMIYTTFSPFPTYSWTIMVMTHEMGHLLGSRHTHACVWNGNNTAIDGCSGSVEGSCALPGIPVSGGTMMSYCHLQSVGINFNLGFGPQPGALILGNFNAATCLTGNSIAPTGLTTTLITNNSAKLNWLAVTNATNYTVEYKQSSSATWIPLGTFTTTTANLSSLLQNTSYDWHVNADCSPFTSTVTFSTTALTGCGVPTGLTVTNISSATASLNWNAFAGATNYQARYRKKGTTTWNTAAVVPPVRNLTGLAQLTTYEWQARSKCSGVWTAWTGKKLFATISAAPPATYCASNGASQAFEYISNVAIGTINNTSGSSGYTDFTANSTASGLGSTVAISVGLTKVNATDVEYVSIFVDFNRDGDFDDAGETVFAANSAAATFTGSFVIPGSANAGQTRMRVAMNYGAAPLTCGSNTYGEVEDYILNMTSPLPAPLPSQRLFSDEETSDIQLAPNPASDKIDVTLNTEDGNYTLMVYSVTGQLVKQLQFSGTTVSVSIIDLPKGVYQLSIIATDNSRMNKMFVKQ